MYPYAVHDFQVKRTTMKHKWSVLPGKHILKEFQSVQDFGSSVWVFSVLCVLQWLRIIEGVFNFLGLSAKLE